MQDYDSDFELKKAKTKKAINLKKIENESSESDSVDANKEKFRRKLSIDFEEVKESRRNNANEKNDKYKKRQSFIERTEILNSQKMKRALKKTEKV